jgi:hypothetical protein
MVNTLECTPNIARVVMMEYYRKRGQKAISSLREYIANGISEVGRGTLAPLIERMEKCINAIQAADALPSKEQNEIEMGSPS